jgi:spore coat protein U-like protein
MRRVDRICLTACAFALGGTIAPARAGACTISTTAVAFGTYNPLSAAPKDGTGTINLACAPSVHAPEVALDGGLNGSVSLRKLASGANRINYNLYTTTARTVIWGDGTSGTVTQTLSGGTVSAGTRNFSATVYGRAPALQNVKAGAYADTITVTVTF